MKIQTIIIFISTILLSSFSYSDVINETQQIQISDQEQLLSIETDTQPVESRNKWDHAKETAKKALQQSKEASDAIWEASKETSKEAWSDSKELSTEVWDNVKEKSSEIIEDTNEVIENLLETPKKAEDEILVI